MPSKMQSLHDEHKELFPHVDQLRTTAEGITGNNARLLREQIVPNVEFLADHLLIHAMAEDEVLYPAVERAMKAPGATATMAREHVEVKNLTEELAALLGAIPPSGPSGAQITDARRLLFGLYALVGSHFAKEEEFFVPALEAALSQAEADKLYNDMEEAAGRLRKPAEPLAV
ncbi:MAG: hemerythrin domain-containing protein [Tepidiformaceae bacterium]